jgi:hypothetical protein
MYLEGVAWAWGLRGYAMEEKMRPTFEAWMRAVDAELVRRSGLCSGDLADCCYRDWYDDEMPPREAAGEVLEAEGFPS